MLLKELLRELDKLCPFAYQEDFDNSGLQVGAENHQCQHLLLAFDFTEDVLKEAVAKGCDTIITHHPFLFHGLKQVDASNWSGRMIYQLIENKIALIALHTNLDKIDFGVNMQLATDLGLQNIEVFLPEASGCGLGAVGQLAQPQTMAEFIATVKQNLNCPWVKYVGQPEKTVSYIGVLGGAGAEYLSAAQEKGLDVYVSSDFKYHDAQQAQNIDLCIIDAGHFGTEVGVVKALGKKLREELKGLQISVSENMADYWQYE